MKNLITVSFLIVCVLCGTLAMVKATKIDLFESVKQTFRDTLSNALLPEVEQAERARAEANAEESLLKRDTFAMKRANLHKWETTRFYSVVFVLGSVCVSVLIISSGLHRAHVKRAQVHMLKIGKYHQIPIHERDLSKTSQIALGLVNAEELKQHNGGLEKAFELYASIAEVQTKQIRALVGRSGLHRIEPQSEPPALMPYKETPSFASLLQRGDIAKGSPLILGYQNGIAHVGSSLDLLSCAVAGESGSGKTSTMLFLSASVLLCEGANIYAIDPHYPHEESFAAKIKPLWDCGLVQVATAKHEMIDVLDAIETHIDRRLTQQETQVQPVVLIIDELAILIKSSLGERLQHIMQRISMEGRKVKVYMLASSQTWLADSLGKSVIRDTLTSAYVHHIKPKQANLILQDREECQKVKKYVKKAGQVLLMPVRGESKLCDMPLTTEEDMRYVANMLSPIVVDRPVDTLVDRPSVNRSVNQRVNRSVNPTDLSDPELVNRIKSQLKQGDITEIAKRVDMSKQYVSGVLQRKKNLTGKLKTEFIHMLEDTGTDNVIPFRGRG